MVAAHSADVGFLVFVSGSGIPVWEQEVYRTGAMMRAKEFSDAAIAEAEAYQRRVFDVSRTGLGWAALDSYDGRVLRRVRAPEYMPTLVAWVRRVTRRP